MKNYYLLLLAILLTAHAADAQSPRLKAETIRKFASQYSDSTVYFYSNGRSSDMKFGPTLREGTIKYDEALNYYVPIPSGNPELWRKLEQTFDGNNNILSTIISHYVGGVAYPLIFTTYSYNALQLPDTIRNEWDNTREMTVKTYTPTGLPKTTTELKFDTILNAYKQTYRDTNIYDGSGRLVKKTTTKGENTYTYDAQGRLLFEYSTYNWFTQIERTSYTYQGNYIFTERGWWDGSGWQPFITTTAQTDAMGNFVNYVYRYYSTGFLARADSVVATYNTYGQALRIHHYRWDPSFLIWKDDRLENYYYEDTTTSVAGVQPPPAGSLTVFPVPAHNTLHIAGHWKTAQPYTLAIHDMQGRTLLQWQQPSAKELSNTIPLSGIPPGNYILTLTGASESMSRQFVVK